MAKDKTRYVCALCAFESPRWLGRCPSCGEWNSISEALPKNTMAKKTSVSLVRLSSLSAEDEARLDSSIAEFNLVCGGGIVPGSVILIGGDPGVGKSTLALQIAQKFRSLYISGEESPTQLKKRALRLGANLDTLMVSTATDVDEIITLSGSEKPDILLIDSIQTILSPDMAGIAGSVGQIRESASRLSDYARESGVPVVLVGHITKDGTIAGPKVLEHMVDTVLYFEGDFARDLRILRAFKNRYGSVNEVGLFRMTKEGLCEVRDRNHVFLDAVANPSPGCAVSAALEGSRILLFEVQSLVAFTSFSNPRRMADGLDLNRLLIIIAVLEKHASLKLGSFDVFINVSGGFHITETAADLAVAAAIASSAWGKSIPGHTGFIGEISLTGDLRPVLQSARRANEFAISGFDRLFVAEGDMDEIKNTGFAGIVTPVRTVSQMLEILFGENR